MFHHKEQIVNYVLELIDTRDWWHVLMAGGSEPISMHNTKREALAAIKRYQKNDERRRARIADHVDGYDRDDLGESPDY